MLICVIVPKREVYGYDEVVVVIDAGHGGAEDDGDNNLGAKYNDVNEKDVDLITAKALYDELSEYGNVSVYLTREDDRKMSLEERVEFAKSVKADLLVSVHYNASEFHRFYGAEIFTSAFGNCYAYGKSVGEHIMAAWENEGAESKGIKTRIGNSGQDYYGIIRHGVENSIPTIILEHGYLDNNTDWQRIGNEEAWTNLGIIDARAIAEFYGLQKSVVQQKINPDLSVSIPNEVVSPDTTAPEKVDVAIDKYNPRNGIIEYTVYAKDEESNLMYYAMDIVDNTEDDSESYMDLKTWELSGNYMEGTFKVPKGFKGNVAVRVYNNYELYTDSEIISISPEMPEASVLDDAGLEVPEDYVEQTDDTLTTDKKSPSEKILDEIEKMRAEIENGEGDAASEEDNDEEIAGGEDELAEDGNVSEYKEGKKNKKISSAQEEVNQEVGEL